MSAFADDDRSDSEIIHESLPSVISTSNIQHVVDGDTAYRRTEKARKMKAQQELENMRNSRLSELAIKRQRDIDAANAKSQLLRNGWLRRPQIHERFYKVEKCIFGCSDPICFLAENSPNIRQETDFTNIAYNTTTNHTNGEQPLKVESFGTANNLEQHLCSDLNPDKMQKVIQYLLKSNLELRTELVKSEQRTHENIRAYSMVLGR